MERTTKTLWYKRAKVHGQPSTLADLLAAALSDRPKAAERLMGGENIPQMGINLHQTSDSMLFGQFLSFEPGLRHTAMTVDADRPAFDLESMAAEATEDGKRREFLESIAYFGVVDDHLILVQTRSLTSRDFEDYLRWLLMTQTQQVPQGTMLTLEDPAANTARNRAARRDIRGLTIGGQVTTVASPETDGGDAVARHELHPGALAALRAFLPVDVLERLSLADSLEADNIELRLTVRIKGKRVASDAGQEFLRTLGRATRHLDPRDYALELNGNGSLKGSELKLQKGVSVQTHGAGGLVNEDTLILRMKEWLRELNTKRLIDP